VAAEAGYLFKILLCLFGFGSALCFKLFKKILHIFFLFFDFTPYFWVCNRQKIALVFAFIRLKSGNCHLFSSWFVAKHC